MNTLAYYPTFSASDCTLISISFAILLSSSTWIKALTTNSDWISN